MRHALPCADMHGERHYGATSAHCAEQHVIVMVPEANTIVEADGALASSGFYGRPHP